MHPKEGPEVAVEHWHLGENERGKFSELRGVYGDKRAMTIM